MLSGVWLRLTPRRSPRGGSRSRWEWHGDTARQRLQMAESGGGWLICGESSGLTQATALWIQIYGTGAGGGRGSVAL